MESIDITKIKSMMTMQLTTNQPDIKRKTMGIPPRTETEVGRIAGSGLIAQIWLTFKGWFRGHWSPEIPHDQAALKSLVLRIYWDGADKPAVEAPVGDFFGVGLCRPANFCSRYFGMSSGGFFCKFPMPFKKGARITLENTNKTEETRVFMNVLYQLEENSAKDERVDSVGYFHTQYNAGYNNGSEPLLIADVLGKGHYIGCTLSMQSKFSNYFAYLEAPEYVFVDDDFSLGSPRIMGTGLEDYMLGGWYFREGAFIGPYHGVVVKDALRSSVSMYRIHEADAVYFNRRLRFQFINPFDADKLKPYWAASVAFLYTNSPDGMNAPMPPQENWCCPSILDVDAQSIP
ncbi:hypothetical protein AGMMS49992_21890 [Clostridia bacterium]|nr:hypothetical protein AGMMS49992_21890 [Clostridia bacterium]